MGELGAILRRFEKAEGAILRGFCAISNRPPHRLEFWGLALAPQRRREMIWRDEYQVSRLAEDLGFGLRIGKGREGASEHGRDERRGRAMAEPSARD
jgi:hypothetical protein